MHLLHKLYDIFIQWCQFHNLENTCIDAMCVYTDAVARGNAFYEQGSGPINLDEAACTGSEMRLIDCPFDDTHDCTHAEDAGVDCSTTCKHVNP